MTRKRAAAGEIDTRGAAKRGTGHQHGKLRNDLNGFAGKGIPMEAVLPRETCSLSTPGKPLGAWSEKAKAACVS